MKTVRLKSYYIYVGNFDFLDKKLQFSTSLIDCPKLDCFVVHNNLSKFQSNKLNLMKGLILEILSNQRFLTKKDLSKFFCKSFIFTSTLRKSKLFLFLDLCLNTVFLYDTQFLNLTKIQIENNFYLYLANEVINYFGLTSNITKCSYQFRSLLQLRENNSNYVQSFYFIPN